MCVVCGSVCVSLGVCVYVCVCNMKGYVLCSLDAQMQSSRYFSIDENPPLVKIYTILDTFWTGIIDPSHLQPQMI